MPKPCPVTAALFLLAAMFFLPGFRAEAQTPDPALLRRGVNITHWFSGPSSWKAEDIQAYMPDADITQIRAMGFTFVRLPVMPSMVQQPDGTANTARLAVLVDAVKRIEAHGLAVMIVPVHSDWRLEQSRSDRDKLVVFWTLLAPQLKGLSIRLTLPELLNEPVFKDNPKDWYALEARLVSIVRSSLPDDTIVLTSTRWSSADALAQRTPFSDHNVVYSFHFYDPPALTNEGNWDRSLDRAVFRALPFPVTNTGSCLAKAALAANKPSQDAASYYCKQGWTEVSIAARIQPAVDWGRSHGVFVVGTEFGILSDHEQPSRNAYLKAVRTTMEKAGIGWGLWGYDSDYGLDLPYKGRVPGAVPDAHLLNALGLTSPVP
jgi:endoglucanase